MSLKRYRNVGTTDIRLNKRLTVKVGEETTEFIAIEPALENFLLTIGSFEVIEEKKKGKDVSAIEISDPDASVLNSDGGGTPAVSADFNPVTAAQALSESQIKEFEKANKKGKK